MVSSTPSRWACFCLCLLLVGCPYNAEEAPEDSGATEDVQAEEGGARLQLIAPPEASDLWPLAADWQVRVHRVAAGQPGELAAEVVGPLDEAIRVAPFAGVATSFSIELRDPAGGVKARARTPAAIYDQTEVDREVPAFLLPMDKVVSVVDDKGKSPSVKGLLGRTVTAMGTGEVLLVGGSAYVGGAPCGEGAVGAPEKTVQRFDPADGGVTQLSALSQARSFHVAVPMSTVRLAVVGGYISGAGGLQPTATVELIRIDAGVVQKAPHGLSTARARACGVAVGKRLVIAGGVGSAAASLEVWDPAIGTIGKPLVLPSARSDAGCASAVDPVNERNLFFISGGANGSTLASDILPFAVEDDGLVPYAPIGLPGGGLKGGFFHAPQGAFALVIAGGFGSGGLPVDKAWLNLLASATTGFQSLPALKKARGCAASAIVGQGGRALMIGGMGAAGEPLASLEHVVLDGSPGKQTGGALPTPQAGGAAAALDDGSILLVGGVALVAGALEAADGLWRYLPADDAQP